MFSYKLLFYFFNSTKPLFLKRRGPGENTFGVPLLGTFGALNLGSLKRRGPGENTFGVPLLDAT
jgi:hypothetical protein